MAAGCKVHDIGLALSPMAYFAQFALDVPCVAMVTASHNDNGWTGVKMGAQRPVTFGPDEMGRLKEIVLAGAYDRGRRRLLRLRRRTSPRRYIADLTDRRADQAQAARWSRPAATARPAPSRPRSCEQLGVEVIPLDTELDYTFPRYNPNPEDMEMLHAMADAVREHGADVGLGFDGDGDRCGVVDNEGDEIFADKIGVMLARDLSSAAPGRHVRGRREVDRPVRHRSRADRATASRPTTGRPATPTSSAASHDLKALAGFEKSGHFFFNAPVGRGYDDGLVTAIAVLDMLDRNPGKSMADLYRALPKTYGSPTMSPHCADEVKYGVVDARGEALPGHAGRRASRSPASRSATSSPSTACA